MSPKRLQQIGVSLLATAAFAVIGLALWFVLAQETYVVYADGQTHEVQGSYSTVQEVVTAAGLQTIAQDIVQPDLASTADPASAITIQRAHEVTVQTDDGRRSYWTFAQTIGSFMDEIGLYPQRTDQIFADGLEVSIFDIGKTAVPSLLEMGTFVTVTIIDGETQKLVRTGKNTVGEAIQDAGLTIYAADQTSPPIGSWLRPDMVITIKR